MSFRFVVLLALLAVACSEDSPSDALDVATSSQAVDSFAESSSAVSLAELRSSAVAPVSSAIETKSSAVVVESSSVPTSSAVKPVSSESAVASSSATIVAESSSSSAVASSSAVIAPASSAAMSSDSNGDDGVCSNCDSFTAADPVLTEKGGKGSVTTYGSVTAKETSLGGACNYGQTNIQYYAAIHVNVSPGDNLGPWQGGSACGGCVHVKARTPDGWKEVTVRITDRCPDANCGVDLGGAPASDIMGDRVGRYSGEWEFVSCEGVEGVWGDSTSIWVKEGASKFWSIIQVRNPKDAVKSITLKGAKSNDVRVLEMVVGTENFWTVPPEVLQTDDEYTVTVEYRSGKPDTWLLKGSDLAVEEANLYLHEHRAE